MPENKTVFNKTYQNYLQQVMDMDLSGAAGKLGIHVTDDIRIPFMNSEYIITRNGVKNTTGQKASYDICIVLFKYIILCPGQTDDDTAMVSFKDFKDSGPLWVYFGNEVEQKVCSAFSLRLDDLKEAAVKLGGYTPDIRANYDAIVQFDMLPKIRVALLFNDRDDEFDAQAKLLFEQRAQDYLDAECLAIMGNLLIRRLIEQVRNE